MKAKDCAIFGIIMGFDLALFLIPFSDQLPIMDFILAYFRPYFGWTKLIFMRLGFMGFGFLINAGRLMGMFTTMSGADFPLENIVPIALVLAVGTSFFWLFYLDRMMTKKGFPFRN